SSMPRDTWSAWCPPRSGGPLRYSRGPSASPRRQHAGHGAATGQHLAGLGTGQDAALAGADVALDLVGRRAVVQVLGDGAGERADRAIAAAAVAAHAGRHQVRRIVRPALAVR